MSIRAFATDTPRNPAAILTLSNARRLNDCAGSRTRDDESHLVMGAFPITPGVEYETAIVGDQFMIYKKIKGGAYVKQTTGDAARKVLDMNRAAKALWSDNA